MKTLQLIALLFFCGCSVVPKCEQYEITVKAYCPCKLCCGEWADGLTKLETDAYQPGVAVPKNGPIPLGAIVEVPGYGAYVADDVGGNLTKWWKKEKRLVIEVRFKTHEEALQWGNQKHKIRVWAK